MPTITLKEALARGLAEVTTGPDSTIITLRDGLTVDEGELVLPHQGTDNEHRLTGEAEVKMTREEALKALFGIWKDKNVTLEDIRREAWGYE